MPMSRRFISCDICETKIPNVWQVKLTYSYYSLYAYEESRVFNDLNQAIRFALMQRCEGGSLRVVNRANVNVKLMDDSPVKVSKKIDT